VTREAVRQVTWGSPGSVVVERAGEQQVLCLAGEIDLAVAQEFEKLHRSVSVAVDAIDAGAVTFLASAGVRLMLHIREQSRAQGRPAVLRQSSPAVDRILELTGLGGVFNRPNGG